MSEIIWHLSFSTRLILLDMIPFTSVNGFVANGEILFLFYGWARACVCVCVCVCVYHFHQLMGSYFCILAVVNNAAVIIRVHTSFQSSVFVFSGVKLPGHLVALIS